MTSAVIGIGTLLQVGDGAGTEVFTTIPEVKSISGPEITRDTIDVTHMNSPNNFREFVTTLKDGGEVSFEMNYIGNDTTQNGIRVDLKAGTLRNFKMVMNNVASTTFDFAAVVTEFGLSTELEEIVTASVTLKISGDITES